MRGLLTTPAEQMQSSLPLLLLALQNFYCTPCNCNLPGWWVCREGVPANVPCPTMADHLAGILPAVATDFSLQLTHCRCPIAKLQHPSRCAAAAGEYLSAVPHGASAPRAMQHRCPQVQKVQRVPGVLAECRADRVIGQGAASCSMARCARGASRACFVPLLQPYR